MKNTTVLVPTFNRPHYLRRLLQYYDRVHFGGEILVLDSSEPGNETDCNGLSLNLQIIKYPSDIFLLDKAVAGVKLVTTEFTQNCADDDFIAAEGITVCESFLQQNPDYSAAQGHCVHFCVERNRQRFVVRKIRGEPNYDLDQDDPLARLAKHVSDYRPTHYALQRTDAVVKCFDASRALDRPSLQAMEVIPSMKCVLSGKVKRLPVPFEFREQHPHRLSGSIPHWIDLITSDDWQRQYKLLEQFLSVELAGVSPPDAADEGLAELYIQEWLRLCMKKYFVRKDRFEALLPAEPRLNGDLLSRAVRVPKSIFRFIEYRMRSKEVSEIPKEIVSAILSSTGYDYDVGLKQ